MSNPVSCRILFVIRPARPVVLTGFLPSRRGEEEQRARRAEKRRPGLQMRVEQAHEVTVELELDRLAGLGILLLEDQIDAPISGPLDVLAELELGEVLRADRAGEQDRDGERVLAGQEGPLAGRLAEGEGEDALGQGEDLDLVHRLLQHPETVAVLSGHALLGRDGELAGDLRERRLRLLVRAELVWRGCAGAALSPRSGGWSCSRSA